MTPKFKILAIAIVAMLVSGGTLAAVAVKGAAPEYHVESAPATLTGSLAEGQSVMRFGGAAIKCSGATSTGTLSSTSSSTITLAPSYSGCVIAGVVAKVEMNGCEYTYHLKAGSSPPEGTVDLVCPESSEPDIKIGKACDVKFEPNQLGVPKYVIKKTSGPPADFDDILTVSGLKYTASGCMFIKDGTYTNGETEEITTIKADRNDGTQQPIWVE